MKKLITLISYAIILIACNNNNNNNNNNNTEEKNNTATTVSDAENQTNDELKTIEQNGNFGTNELLSLFSKNKNEVLRKLKTASKEDADILYENYFKNNQIILSKITASQIDLLDRFYDDDNDSKNQIKNLNYTLKNHNLIFDELGEGYVEITTIHNFYYDIFHSYVTEDYKAYLFLKSEEGKSTYSADAGLVISFRELGERIIAWENFISKYSESKLTDKIKEEYKDYQKDYLFGLDNTPTVERVNPKSIYIYEENIQEFNRFMKKYPESPTTRLIKIFFENFRNEYIYDLINAEQNKF